MKTMKKALLLLVVFCCPRTAGADSKWFTSYLASPNTAAVRYGTPQGMSQAFQGTEAAQYMVMAAGGTLQADIKVSTAPGGATGHTIGFRNTTTGTDTTCAITGTATTCSTATVAVAAGDRVVLKNAAPTGSPAATQVSIELTFSPTTPNVKVWGSNTFANLATADASTNVVPVVATGVSTSVGTQAVIMTETGCFTRFDSYLEVAPGAGVTRSFFVNIGGVNSALTTVYANTNVGQNSTSDCVPFYPGDLVEIRGTVSGGVAAASTAAFGIAYTTNTANAFMVPMITGTLNTATNCGTSCFAALVGNGANNVNATETAVQTYINAATFSITKMRAYAATAPGAAGDKWTVNLQDNTVAVTGATFDIEDGTKNDTAAFNFNPSAGSLLSIKFAPTATPLSTSIKVTLTMTMGAGGGGGMLMGMAGGGGAAGAGVLAKNADIFWDLEDASADGTAVDPTVAQNGARASGGSFTTSPNPTTAFDVDTDWSGNAMFQSVVVNNTTYTGASSTRSYIRDLNDAADTVTWTLPRSCGPVVVFGAWFKTPTFDGGVVNNTYNVVLVTGNGGGLGTTSCVLAIQDTGGTANDGVHAHAQYPPAQSTVGTNIGGFASATRYYATALFDSTNDVCKVAAFDEAGVQMGGAGVTSNALMDAGGQVDVSALEISNGDSLRVDTINVDNIAFKCDATAADFPYLAP